MNHRYLRKQLSFLLVVLVALPGLSSAQLSSTNYQVDVYGVGDENAGIASSSQYQIEGAVGSSYEIGSSVSDVADETDTTSGSVRTSRDVPSETNPSNPATTNQESSTQKAPGSSRDQGSDSERDIEEVPESLDAHNSPVTSLGSKKTDEGISNEAHQDTTDGCVGLLACYWWVFLGGLVVLGMFYLYSRRKI